MPWFPVGGGRSNAPPIQRVMVAVRSFPRHRVSLTTVQVEEPGPKVHGRAPPI